jgi:hypothetical protein
MALYSPAWPLVIRRQFTSHVRVVRCPSHTDPCWASNAASSRPRTAATTASTRSSARRPPAVTATGWLAASSPASSPSNDSTSANFSLAFNGCAAVHMAAGSPPPLGSEAKGAGIG